MTQSEKTYQSILLNLSTIPVDYLKQVDNYLQNFKKNIKKKNNDNSIPKDLLSKLKQPIETKLNLDEIKKKQNYQGFNREKFSQLIKEIDAKEPIDELLSALSK